MTLSDLIEDGANAIIRLDAGNGSAGPAWIDWDQDVEAELGDISMSPVKATEPAYEQAGSESTIARVLGQLGLIIQGDELYASDWIITGKGDNPYRFRLIL